MWGIGISFGVDLNNSSGVDRDQAKKQAYADKLSAAYAGKPGFWETIFGSSQQDTYAPLPKHMRSSESYAAWRAKNGNLDEPQGR